MSNMVLIGLEVTSREPIRNQLFYNLGCRHQFKFHVALCPCRGWRLGGDGKRPSILERLCQGSVFAIEELRLDTETQLSGGEQPGKPSPPQALVRTGVTADMDPPRIWTPGGPGPLADMDPFRGFGPRENFE